MGEHIFVNSPHVRYTQDFIEAEYQYTNNIVKRLENGQLQVMPQTTNITLRTEKKIPKLGVLLIGFGGNNGSTFTAALIANKQGIEWKTNKGIKSPNWLGSITQSSNINLGRSDDGDVNVCLKELLPMVEPDDIIVDGWDISSANLGKAMVRAKVLDYDLQRQLIPLMEKITPKPSIYRADFVASNQADRVDNILQGTLQSQLEKIQADIREMKAKVDKVIILWTANTERMIEIVEGIHDTDENILNAIASGDERISPSIVFAIASILEKCTYINGSPQNTFVPGVIQLAHKNGVFLAGNDFKSGQTKVKSVIVDFLFHSGLKPVAIASYNHLGNNDGKNLSEPKQFKSKEMSKSFVIDDMEKANKSLYKEGEYIDHIVVIKYVPYVGDSKRALDEYTSEIMLGGINTLVIHNTCEDSLLAVPIILDLIILAELSSRITFKTDNDAVFQPFSPILSMLNYFWKSPLVPEGVRAVNALMKQKACIENILRACLGLPPEHNMGLEHKLFKFSLH